MNEPAKLRAARFRPTRWAPEPIPVEAEPPPWTYDFDTTGPVCIRVTAEFTSWLRTNISGRLVKVNGAFVTCATFPLPPRINGADYIWFGSGIYETASFSYYYNP